MTAHDDFRKVIIEKTLKVKEESPVVEEKSKIKGEPKILERPAEDMLSEVLQRQLKNTDLSKEEADERRKKVLEATKGSENKVANLMKGL